MKPRDSLYQDAWDALFCFVLTMGGLFWVVGLSYLVVWWRGHGS